MKAVPRDYSKYTYSWTLKELDEWHEKDIDKVNYADVLLSMNDATSIEECVNIYNRVYKKYSSTTIGIYVREGKLFIEDMNKCLNGNIVRLLKSPQSELSIDYLKKSLVNLRPCSALKGFQTMVLKVAEERNLSIIDDDINRINETVSDFNDNLQDIKEEKYGSETNGYRRVRKEFAENLKILEQYGFIISGFEKQYREGTIKSETIAWIIVAVGLLICTLIFGFTKIFGTLAAIGLFILFLTTKHK